MTNRYVPEPTGTFSLEWVVRELNRISYDLEQLHMSGYDFGLEVARGNVSGMSKVNKFGRATFCDATEDTDIHDGANENSYPTAALDDRPTWVAPTAARVHAIKSTSDEDSDTGGSVAQGDGVVNL